MLKDIWPMLLLVTILLVVPFFTEQESTHGRELNSDLFKPVVHDGSDSLPTSDGVVAERMRLVEVDFAQLGTATERIRLNLFADTTVTAVRQQTTPNALGDGLIWFGKIEEAPHSQVILVVKNHTLVGTISLDNHAPARSFEVLPIADGKHRIQEMHYDLNDHEANECQLNDMADSNWLRCFPCWPETCQAHLYSQ